MDIDERRQHNVEKAEREGERGPARDSPDAAPVGDAITAFHERGDLAFGIPAHRSGTGGVTPDAVDWAGEQAFRADVGMNNGVDNRHQSWQVEPTAMQLFAQATGAGDAVLDEREHRERARRDHDRGETGRDDRACAQRA
jgi:arginine decarboxylase